MRSNNFYMKKYRLRDSVKTPLAMSLAVLFILLGYGPQALGWTLGHSPATAAALDTLPAGSRELWKSQEKELVNTYVKYPDGKCEDAGKYLFSYQGVAFHCFPYESIQKNRERCLAAFIFYFARIKEAANTGDMTSAAKYVGCLAHAMQDCGDCQHGLEGPLSPAGADFPTGFPLLQQLYPTPSGKEGKPAHLVLQGSIGDQTGQTMADIPGYKPILLGATPEEAAFHLYERYWDQYKSARGKVCNIIEAYYADDSEGIRKNMSEMVKESARCTADILYTAACISKGRFDSDDVTQLTVVHLENITPSHNTSYMPDSIYSHHPIIKNGNLDLDRKLIPLTVLMQKDGQLSHVSFTNGIGTGCSGGCSIQWDVPAGIFAQLRVSPGMNSLLKSGSKCQMKVVLNQKVVYDTGPVSEKDVCEEAVIDMSGGGYVNFRSERIGEGYPVNHVVWGNPVLVRMKNLPGNTNAN